MSVAATSSLPTLTLRPPWRRPDAFHVALGVVLAGVMVLPSVVGSVWLIDWTDAVERGVLGLAEATLVLVWARRRGLTAPARGLPTLIAALGIVWWVASVVSMVTAAQVAPAVVRTAEWSLHLAFGLVVKASAEETSRTCPLWRTSSLVGVAVVMAAAVMLWASLAEPELHLWNAEFPFVRGARWAGTYGLLAVTVGAIPLLAGAAEPRKRLASMGWMALGWGAIWWSGSRGALGAAAGATLLMVFLSQSRGRLVAAAAGASVLGALGSIPLSMPRFGMGVGRLWAALPPGGESYGSGRSGLWLTTWEAWAAHPWLGVGPDGLAPLLFPVGSAHAHNTLLQALAEWGLLGGVPFVVAGTLLLIAAVQSGRRAGPDRMFRAGAAAYLVALALNGLLEGLFYDPGTTLLAAAAAGVAMAGEPLRGAPPRQGRHALQLVSLACGGVLVLHLAVLRAVWAPGIPPPGTLRPVLVCAFPSAPILQPVVWWGHEWAREDPAAAADLARWGRARGRAPWTFLRLEADLDIAAGRTEEAAAVLERAEALYQHSLRNAPPWIQR